MPNVLSCHISTRLERWRLRFVSDRYYAGLRGKFVGRRGFVIGNGPSLKVSDLERLTGEVSITSNKIYLAYDQTHWRPTFHTMIDPLVVEKIGGVIGNHAALTHVPDFLAHLVPTCPKRVYRYLGLVTTPPGDDAPQFSPDMNAGVYCGSTVTYDNLQFAVHLGLNPIYLIGCDHYYAGEKDVVANQPITAGAAQNHFMPNYRQPGEIVNPAPIALMNAAYAHARRYADIHGYRILNATRGGHLEVYERVDFDSLFPSRPASFTQSE